MPRPGELLSSWVNRLAHDHGLLPYAFTHSIWPTKPLLARDLDSFAFPEVSEALIIGTGVTKDQIRQTTLQQFAGIVFGHHFRNGLNQWVNPIGVRGRERRQHGLQYCPRCLAEDEIPYFRLSWRLTFVTVCHRHGFQLLDQCGKCGAILAPHRSPDQSVCYRCRTALSAAKSEPASAFADAFQLRCELALSQGWANLGDDHFAYSPLFFATLRAICKTLSSGTRADRLRNAIAEWLGGDPTGGEVRPRAEIEYLRTIDRHRLFDLCERVLHGWPIKYAAACQEAGLWHSWAMKDLRNAPFAYAHAAKNYLKRSNYVPTAEEVQAAAKYLIRTHPNPNREALRHLVGETRHAYLHFSANP